MFIGSKEIKEKRDTGEKTPGGTELVEVEYTDGTREIFSSLIYEKIVSEKSCNDSELREKRVRPIVEVTLAVLREWGLKTGELGYFSALLNQSLQYNEEQAIIELYSQWMPRPNSSGEVDLVTIDRILKTRKQTLKDVIGDGQTNKEPSE